MINPAVQLPRSGSPVDGDSDKLASRPNACAEGLEMDGERRGWRLRAIHSSVPTLRRELTDFLRAANLPDDDRNDLLLAACEAASNAVEHAQDPSEPFVDVLSEIDDARVTIVVLDHGHWRDAAPGEHRGRGLAMMWILAETTIVPGPSGTTVTIRSSPRHGGHPVPPDGPRSSERPPWLAWAVRR